MLAFLRDFQHAARTLSKARAAAAVAILALALGIGVNVSAFIAVNGIILHPLPFPNLDRIVTIWESTPKVALDRMASSPANFLDLQSEARSFLYLAACRSRLATLRNGSTSEIVRLAEVSPAFFDVLSSKARFGRVLGDESQAVVVSEAFWKTRLASSPDVLGHTLHLSQGSFNIVGVMPDNFDYPLGTEIWSPLLLTPADRQQRSVHDLLLVGLLKPGVAASQANSEAAAIATHLAAEYPATNRDRSFTVIPVRDLSEGVTDRFVAVILCTAGFVLLLACANIGNLQLARAAGRRKEIAVRAALEPVVFKSPAICSLNLCCSLSPPVAWASCWLTGTTSIPNRTSQRSPCVLFLVCAPCASIRASSSSLSLSRLSREYYAAFRQSSTFPAARLA